LKIQFLQIVFSPFALTIPGRSILTKGL